MGFFYWLLPCPLIQGLLVGVVLVMEQHWNLVAIGLGHYIFGETGAMKLKGRKASMSPNQHSLPSPVPLPLHLPSVPCFPIRHPLLHPIGLN